jgi:hypothetical protein
MAALRLRAHGVSRSRQVAHHRSLVASRRPGPEATDPAIARFPATNQHPRPLEPPLPKRVADLRDYSQADLDAVAVAVERTPS